MMPYAALTPGPSFTIINSVLIFICWPFLFSCNSERDIRDYYFPVRELTDGLVYEYENLGNFTDAPFEYWYLLGVDRDTALYLSTTHYLDGLTPDQLTRERITNEGAFIQELVLNSSESQIRPEILYDRSFSFYPTDGRATGYRIAFTPTENQDATNYVSLDRIFRGDTTLSVMGEQRAAIVFDLVGEVSQRDPVEGDISPTFTGYEIFSEGLGLVEYQRDLGAGGLIAGKLTRRILMPDYAASIVGEAEN